MDCRLASSLVAHVQAAVYWRPVVVGVGNRKIVTRGRQVSSLCRQNGVGLNVKPLYFMSTFLG